MEIHEKGHWFYAVLDGGHYVFKTENNLKSESLMIEVYHLLNLNDLLYIPKRFSVVEPILLNLMKVSILSPLTDEGSQELEKVITDLDKEKPQIAPASVLPNKEQIEDMKRSGKLFLIK